MQTSEPITTMHARVLQFIQRFAVANGGRVPTLRQICDGTALKSTSTAHYAIETLIREGRLRKVTGFHPAYAIVPNEGCCSTCGQLLPATEATA